MDLLSTARRILEAAEYVTRSGSLEDTFVFEDESLAGFVSVASDASSILKNWEAKQGAFLSSNDQRLRKSKGKSWNLYSVFLTEADPSPEEENKLVLIEEDFRGTRKLARGGLRTNPQATRALFPLLPLQNPVALGEDNTVGKLRGMLSAIPTALLEAIEGPASPEEVAKLIRRFHEDED